MKLLRALALTLSLCAISFGQNAAPMPLGKVQLFNATGGVLSGGYLYSCVAGSACTLDGFPGDPPSNPQATYTDSTATVANANPVILDSGGRANIWLSAQTYKLIATDANGVTQWSADNVSAVTIGQLSGALSVSSLTVSGNATIGGTLAVSSTVTAPTLTISGNGTFGGTLGVTGALTAGSFIDAGDASIAGNAFVGARLTVANVTNTGSETIAGTLGVTGAITGDLTGNASTATAAQGTPTNCSSGFAPTGIDNTFAAQNCTLIPIVQGVSGALCSTTNSAGNTCTTTLTWGTPFSDSLYSLSCTLIAPSGFPWLLGVDKTSTSITIHLTNGQGSQAQVSTAGIDCISHGT